MLPASRCAPRRCWPRRRRASTSSATAGSRWGWVPAPSGMQSTPGRPRLAPGEARRSLEEAIEVLWRIWSGERGIRMDGDHYRLHGAQGGPVPAHRIEVWLGVQGPRMLELLGTKADGWVPSFPGCRSTTSIVATRSSTWRPTRRSVIKRIRRLLTQRQRHHHRRGFSRVPHRPARAVGRATHRLGNRPRNRQLHPLAGGRPHRAGPPFHRADRGSAGIGGQGESRRLTLHRLGQRTATNSISTLYPPGRADTCTVDRAGGDEPAAAA